MSQNPSMLIWLDDDTAKSRRQSIRSQAARWSHHQNVSRKSRFRSRGACACIDDSSLDGCGQPTCRRRWITNSLQQLSHKPIMQVTFNASYEAIVGKRSFAWMSHVAKSSDQSAMIKQSLATIVGGIYSRSFNSQHLQYETNRRYVEIVGYIHKIIPAARADSCLEIIISIFILSMVELLVWDNARKWMMHLDGIAQLMQLSGPENFCDGIGFLTLQCLRNQILALDIFKRRRCFLTCTPWVEKIRWQHETNKTPVDTVSDILLSFPGLLEEYDACTKNAMPFDQLDVDVLRYVQALDTWRQETISSTFPNTGGDVTMESVVTYLIEDAIFEPEMSISVAYYLAGCLLIIRLGPRYTSHLSLSPNQMIDYIIMLCQRYLGYHQTTGSLTWIFPLRVAAYTPTTEPRKLLAEFRGKLEKHSIHSFVSAILFSLPGLNTYIGFMDKKDRRVDGNPHS